jgi:hypothetical protein
MCLGLIRNDETEHSVSRLLETADIGDRGSLCHKEYSPNR